MWPSVMDNTHTMPITVICPNCRESLEIPNELVGGDVRCGSCLEVFTAAPRGGDVPPPLPREERSEPRRKRNRNESSRNRPLPVSRPDDKYGEVEYDPERKRKQGLAPAFWILFGIFGLMGCGCCGVFGWLVYDTMDPQYKEFAPPDGKFVAQFPGDVKQATRLTGRKGGENAPAFEAVRKFVQETYFVYHVELTAAEKRDTVQAVDKLCDGLASANQGTEVSRIKRAHQGHDAADILIRLPGKRFVKARVIAGEGRGYVVGVSVNQDPSGMIWLDNFFEGFEIKTAEKKDEAPKKADEKKPADDDNG